jgi:hypothetical protein
VVATAVRQYGRKYRKMETNPTISKANRADRVQRDTMAGLGANERRVSGTIEGHSAMNSYGP